MGTFEQIKHYAIEHIDEAGTHYVTCGFWRDANGAIGAVSPDTVLLIEQTERCCCD